MPAAADWKLLMGVDPEDLGEDDQKICDVILKVCVHIFFISQTTATYCIYANETDHACTPEKACF